MQVSNVSFTFTVIGALTITNVGNMQNAVQGQAYSFQFQAVGGTTPYNWTATGLPAGLTLSTGGLLSGTPSVVGSFSVQVTVSDSTP